MITNIGTQFIDPSVQFFSNTGTVLASGTVEFWLAGTSTHVNTYSDQGLSSANANPLTLDSAGRATIYLTPVNGTTSGISIKYTLKDSAGATIRTVDNVTVPVATAGGNLTGAVLGFGASTTIAISGNTITPTLNRHMLQPEGVVADQLDTINVTGLPDGALLILGNAVPSAAITVRSGIGNITLTGSVSAVLAAAADRITLIRQGSSFVEVVRSLGAGSTPVVNNSITQGRITIQSLTPVPSADITGSTVYFTPYKGNAIALYDGSAWSVLSFSELSVAVPASADTVFDVFAYNNSGTVALEILAWSTVFSRGTAIVLQNGIWVKSGVPTRKYIGTVATGAAAGVVTDSYQLRYVWNYYNRVKRPLSRGETTDNWTYSVAAFRPANGDSNNHVGTVVGVPEDSIQLGVTGFGVAAGALTNISVGIGVESTTTVNVLPAKIIPAAATAANTPPYLVMTYYADVFSSTAGRLKWYWLEYGSTAGVTWYGDGAIPLQLQSGIYGSVWG